MSIGSNARIPSRIAVQAVLALSLSAGAAIACDCPGRKPFERLFRGTGVIAEGVVTRRQDDVGAVNATGITFRVDKVVKGAAAGELLTAWTDFDTTCEGPAPKVGERISVTGSILRGRLDKDTPACGGADDQRAYDRLQTRHVAEVRQLTAKARGAGGGRAADWDELASLLMDRGDPRMALRAMDSADALDGSTPRGFERATALRAMGEDAKARHVLESAAPFDERAHLLLETSRPVLAGGTRSAECRDEADRPVVDMAGRPLGGRNLAGLAIDGVRVTGLSLTGADLTHAALTCAAFPKAGLRGTDLVGAAVDSSSFRGADLSRARAHGLWAVRASFAGADMRGIDLRDADLSSADLSGADLRGADVTGAVLRGAKWDCRTSLPDGIDAAGLGMVAKGCPVATTDAEP